MNDERGLLPEPTNWPDGWYPIDRSAADKYVDELKRELHPQHELYGFAVTAVAHRLDQDDVLFIARMDAPVLAAVHLTWRGLADHSIWPHTRLYQRFEDWAADELRDLQWRLSVDT
jgi:hypothetical protein